MVSTKGPTGLTSSAHTRTNFPITTWGLGDSLNPTAGSLLSHTIESETTSLTGLETIWSQQNPNIHAHKCPGTPTPPGLLQKQIRHLDKFQPPYYSPDFQLSDYTPHSSLSATHTHRQHLTDLTGDHMVLTKPQHSVQAPHHQHQHWTPSLPTTATHRQHPTDW